MTAIQLHDTAARKKRAFVPQDPSRVTMYVCGPTVYSTAHIGNFRPAITFDVLYRLLRHEYGADHVVYARNITDVDDKINAAAAAEGVDISVITERFAKIYREDSAALNILAPTLEPAATAHMSQMIALMEQLVEGGFAYAAEGHVLFDVTAYEQYGALSKRSLDDMIAGARVEVAPYKRNPADFVLWKPSRPGEPVWESPFGHGRPGWHLECSAMIEATLGQTIDIHGGGADLVFPHHENEIAQSACAHGGAALANYWLHNGFLSIDAEKMSKSLGNIVKPHELLERGVKGEVIRYAMLTGHYRAPLDWNDQLIKEARTRLDRLYRALWRLGEIQLIDRIEPDEVLEALRDDLNTPAAFAALAEYEKIANRDLSQWDRAEIKTKIIKAGSLLGLLQTDAESWLRDKSKSNYQEAEVLLELRNVSKARSNFVKSDALREKINFLGYIVEDSEIESHIVESDQWISEYIEKIDTAIYDAMRSLIIVERYIEEGIHDHVNGTLSNNAFSASLDAHLVKATGILHGLFNNSWGAPSLVRLAELLLEGGRFKRNEPRPEVERGRSSDYASERNLLREIRSLKRSKRVAALKFYMWQRSALRRRVETSEESVRFKVKTLKYEDLFKLIRDVHELFASLAVRWDGTLRTSPEDVLITYAKEFWSGIRRSDFE